MNKHHQSYPGSNEVNNNIKLIRILDFFENEESFNNLNIEQLHASDYSDLLISEDWKVIVNNTGYYPTQNITFTDESITNDDFEDDNNSSSNKNNSKVSKTWKIITIVLSVVLVVVIVVFVILLIFINKKKRYDRSENE